MSKKEQFLALVQAGARAQDLSTGNNDSPLILLVAGRIRKDRVPGNPLTAAKAYLAFCNGAGKRPPRWMLSRK